MHHIYEFVQLNPHRVSFNKSIGNTVRSWMVKERDFSSSHGFWGLDSGSFLHKR